MDGRTNENIVPRRSAFNQRKIPLRKELSGALLEHEYFGSHLDHQENTIDAELHCVTSVRIWSYSGPHFSIFSTNVGKCGKNEDQHNSE